MLGTAARAPTRDRNPNGYLFRWDDDHAILVDPGEGTQRQLVRAGVSPHHVTHICLTHLHADHFLGLPGVLEQIRTDDDHELTVHFPASGFSEVEQLCSVGAGTRPRVHLDPVPIGHPMAWTTVVDEPLLRIGALPLRHSVDTLGWRIEQPARRHLDPARAAQAGIAGTDLGRLQHDGLIRVDGVDHSFDELSDLVPGVRAAVIMDTGVCEAAVELATEADLVLCEATFVDAEATLAAASGHLTARQAATIARQARAHRLVLTHFSGRYDNTDQHQREAEEVFANVSCASDLAVVAIAAPRHAHSRPGSLNSGVEGRARPALDRGHD